MTRTGKNKLRASSWAVASAVEAVHMRILNEHLLAGVDIRIYSVIATVEGF